MKCIITGGAGCLGSVLATELERRAFLENLGRRPGESYGHLVGLKAEIVQGTFWIGILDGFIEEDALVFHLTGVVNITSSKAIALQGECGRV